PLEKWLAAIQEVVLTRCAGQVVVFIDEIDTVRSLAFSTDEFFAGVRECYNRRSDERAFRRLTFCLLGVGTPSDLIRDTKMTPFNIGHRIELSDFTRQEAARLTAGLAIPPRRASHILARILYWTGGHPYLTQRLCQAVAEEGAPMGLRSVDSRCADLFLSHRARERDGNLLFVRERILRSEIDRVELLGLYQRVL